MIILICTVLIILLKFILRIEKLGLHNVFFITTNLALSNNMNRGL